MNICCIQYYPTEEIIAIEKFDDTKILIDTDDKLLDNITLRNV